MRYQCGEFVLDATARQLLRGGQPVGVSPKALAFLDLILERRPAAVSKSDVHDRLWPQTFVSESSLARVAGEARAALDDDARRPRFVRTVYGFGYAFAGTAVEQAGRAARGAFACWVALGGREVPLAEGENVLGRGEDAAVWINSARASRHHARVVVEAEGAVLEDLGSKNGTYLRGRRIQAPVTLADGDEIVVGDVSLVFGLTRGSASTETATSD